MDTSSTPTDSSLDTIQAGEAFAAMLYPEETAELPKKEAAAEPAAAEPEAPEPNAQVEGDDAPSEPSDDLITVEVDGKTIQLTKAQIAEAHKSGLRQDDYTRKTQEVAEQRKAAEAETAKAREERNRYAQGLQQAESVLTAQLQEQQQIDWDKLLATDPVEFMRQKHIAETRQVQLNQTRQQLNQVAQQSQAEHQKALAEHVESQRSELIAKIPEWKDAAVMKAEATELRDYLKTQGLTEQEIYSVTDHRAIIQSRKAMLFDKMMAKAKATDKKMENVPQRVARPAGGQTPAMDRRSATYQRFAKSGSVDDAASVFAQIL